MKYYARAGTDEMIQQSDLQDLDIVHIKDDHYHLVQDHQSYDIQVLETGYKYLKLSINDEVIDVAISDDNDVLIDQMGMEMVAVVKVSDINAPMPGLVLDIMVEAGTIISAGDPLIILEAMKMENILKAPADGIIKNVAVKRGDAVDKGQLLIELE